MMSPQHLKSRIAQALPLVSPCQPLEVADMGMGMPLAIPQKMIIDCHPELLCMRPIMEKGRESDVFSLL
jgi:hypothetical protein